MHVATVPCALCGEPTDFTGTKRCNNCWEVERRLDDFLKSANGRRLLLQKLNTIDVTFLKRWIGKERSRFERIHREGISASSRERAYGESNVCSLILNKINADLRKLKGEG